MEALNRGLFKRAVHPFHLAIGLGMGWLRKALLNAPFVAELPHRMATHSGMMRQIAKQNTIISQQLMSLIGNLR